MTEKLASSEIAQSRERFEKWFREGACFLDDLRRDSSGMYYAMGPRRLYEAWEQSERYARERLTNLVRKECEKYDDITEPGRTVIQALVDVVERIRGKE